MNSLTPPSIRQVATRLPQNVRPCIQCAFRMQQQTPSRRNLSTTQSRKAQAGDMKMQGNVMRMMAGQKSMKSRLKNIKANEVPTDVGLIPQTFVSPGWRKLVTIGKKDQKKLLKVLWLRLKSSVTGFSSAIYSYKWGASRDRISGEKKIKPKLELGNRISVAKDLHNRFYTALAAGDATTLKEISCAGLLSQVQRRLDQRKEFREPNERWKVNMYAGFNPPRWVPWFLQTITPYKGLRVVSDKIMPIPFAKNSTLRQCVVKISSLQQISKDDGSPPRHADLDEYVVIQHMRLEGQKDRGWMIWGTVEESSMQDIDDLLSGKFAEQELGFADQIKARLNM